MSAGVGSEKYHTNTWFSMEGISGITTTSIGVLAGTSVADLLFAAVDAILAAMLHERLRGIGLVLTVDTDAARNYFGSALNDTDTFLARTDVGRIAYVDDALLPIFDTAQNLTKTVAAVAAIAADTYMQHGAQLNFEVGKSEVMLHFNRTLGTHNEGF